MRLYVYLFIPLLYAYTVSAQCGTNEVNNTCPDYCTFEDDCDTKFGGLVRECPPRPDDYICEPRCDCASPYYVRINGECVSPALCPNSSCKGDNQYVGTGCDGTCADPNLACAAVALVACYCLPGYVRDDNGNCVLPENCPCNTTCPGNQTFSKCGSTDRTCEVPNPVCTKECRVGCFCNPGYVKNEFGDCILLENCDKYPQCNGPNEIYTTCGTCDGTCSNPNPFCTFGCQTGCFCLPDYVRDSNGVCIPKKDCGKPTSPTTYHRHHRRRKPRRHHKSRCHHKPRRHQKPRCHHKPRHHRKHRHHPKRCHKIYY